MNAVLEFPPITSIEAAAPLAIVPPAVPDLAKLDLKAVALSRFGDWQKATTDAKAHLDSLALDLTTQAGVDGAITVRNRYVKQPLADARATSKALKSTLTAVSRAVGEELERIESGWEAATKDFTARITSAQATLDAEKAKKAREEAERVAARQQGIANIRAWADHAIGLPSERIAVGIQRLEAMTFTTEDWQEFAVPAANAACETVEKLRKLHAQAVELERLRAAQQNTTSGAAPQQASDTSLPEADAAPGMGAAGQAPETITAKDAEESGSSPADAPATGTPVPYASNEAETAQASPSGEGEEAPADIGAPALQGHTHDLGSLETSEADATNPSAEVVEQIISASAAAPALLRDAEALVAFVATAFNSKFPTHPKPPEHWWAHLRTLVDDLGPRLAAAREAS